MQAMAMVERTRSKREHYANITALQLGQDSCYVIKSVQHSESRNQTFEIKIYCTLDHPGEHINVYDESLTIAVVVW